jgi:zinc and cadmium transporter
MPLLLFTVPILSTLIGGLLAVRFRRYLYFLIAGGAGLLLGAAFLDLLPEAIDLGREAGLASADVLGLTLLSFLLFHLIENSLDRWGGHGREPEVQQRAVGRAGALMLIFHSFRDGLAIGAAYAASHPAGYAVAFGIAAHDVGDGMNTIILTTGGKKPTRTDYAFLLADALAPFFGGLLTAWWVFSPRGSVGLLVLAAGLFFQMATGDFLPEVRRSNGPRRYLLACVFAGALVIYLANLAMARHR